ncbi:MAG: hypothetical protein QN178_05360 [Armatimonadota bacterium]|nr:hypothetical protein [Armatimonadota bacterium]
MRVDSAALPLLFACALSATPAFSAPARLQEYPLPCGARPHDVVPAADGSVWYTAQVSGELGRLDPATGRVRLTKLGDASAPPGGPIWVSE